MPHLQSQWATDHHRSQRKDHFLEVTFNLNKSTYQPFTKPNTTLKYVHRERNHPPTTTQNIPAGINGRLKRNHLQLTNEKIDNGTTYSGTTSYSVKNFSTNIRPDSLPQQTSTSRKKKNFNRNTITISYSYMNNT